MMIASYHALEIVDNSGGQVGHTGACNENGERNEQTLNVKTSPADSFSC